MPPICLLCGVRDLCAAQAKSGAGQWGVTPRAEFSFSLLLFSTAHSQVCRRSLIVLLKCVQALDRTPGGVLPVLHSHWWQVGADR